MSQKQISFWFEFASTYSYLSAWRIEDLAAQAGVDVVWRPFLLGPIFAAQGWTSSPFNVYEAKGKNMWRDLERQTTAYGLPFQPPDPFPQHSLTAARVALAALETPQGPAFCKAVYRRQFGAGQSLSDPATLTGALADAGLPETLADRASDPEIKQRLKDTGAEAAAHELFGAPSFVAGTELFWGDDRLEQAIDWALRH